MADEEEADYMSDAFLESLSAPAPGLVTVKSIARQRATEDKAKKGSLPKGLHEARARDEGLQKQVDPTNKGFSLLMKMGYKPGRGLGKNAEGRAEPVPIKIPEGRSGLGLSTAKQEKRNAIERIRKQLLQAERDRYRSTMAERYKLNRIRGQLVAIRNLCFQLDSEKNITVPISPLFWPPKSEEPTGDSDSPSSSPTRPKVRRLDEDEPADDRSVDEAVPPPPELDDDLDLPQTSSEVKEENPELILERIVRYVRRKHAFCFWCSVQYESAEELTSQCPGPTEADHD